LPVICTLLKLLHVFYRPPVLQRVEGRKKAEGRNPNLAEPEPKLDETAEHAEYAEKPQRRFRVSRISRISQFEKLKPFWAALFAP
jgi:hypothetical protein